MMNTCCFGEMRKGLTETLKTSLKGLPLPSSVNSAIGTATPMWDSVVIGGAAPTSQWTTKSTDPMVLWDMGSQYNIVQFLFGSKGVTEY